ncbi:AAA family ATPase [Macrococcus sp. EM39E]|uniref:AAA family ATPase n=1 Tax=Macrococcus animalis TaxID=3395467 RepID=UPI0039BE52A7
MRPKRLVLKSFGPFKDETIEFDTLQNHKLFLISGKTGAGKTTIFDGIMYALFGEASTSDRDESNLRNINATDDEPTEVIYTFYMQDKQYEIHRDLPFIKSGNKTKKTTQLTVYEVVGGKNNLIASGLKAGKDAILDIVKLNASQFRKIFILPQGEFKSLLVSGSKEKSEILRTIFDTTKIKRLSVQLRDKVANEQKTILAMEAELGVQFGLFQSLIELKVEETYRNNLGHIEKALIELNQQIDTSNNQLNNERDILKAQEISMQDATVLKGNMTALNGLKQSLKLLLKDEQTILTKEADLKHLVQFEHYQVAHNDLTQAQQKQSALEAEVTSQSKKYEDNNRQIKVLQEKLHTLTGQTEDMNKKKHYVIQNERYQSSKYAQLSQQIENYSRQLRTLDQEIITLQTNKSYAESTGKEIALIKQKQLKNDVEMNTLDSKMIRVNNQIDVLIKISKQLDRIQTTNEDITKIKNEISDVRLKLKALHSSEHVQDVDAIQAIKTTLKVGDKCPVCAHTIETLNDATHVEAHQYQITLEKLQQAYQQKQTALNIFIKDVDRIPKLINIYSDSETIVIMNEIDEFNEQLSTLTETKIESIELQIMQQQIVEMTNQFKQQVERAQSDFESLNKEKNYLNDQSIVFEDALIHEKDIEEELTNKQKEQAHIEQLKISDVQAKSMFIEDTGETDYDTFKSKIEQNKNDYLQFECMVSSTEKEMRQYEKEQLILNENISSLNKQIKELKGSISILEKRLFQFNIPESIALKYSDMDLKQTIALFENDIKAFHEEYLSLTNEMKRLSALIDNQDEPDLDNLRKILNEQTEIVDKLHANVSTLQEQHKTYMQHFEKLSKQLNSYESIMSDVRSLILLSNALNGNNPQKIDIETFVLMYYLEQTLLLANIRLRQMTSNRYELRRRIEKRGGGKQGLIIDVFDYNANQSRSITSLSGGETFLASLCLALGLSDFVMQNAGGIHLEAVFIDEGFGTLDNETLEVAISALIDLQTSGKLIGMISHVQLLKERIPALLKIETNGFESHAVFEIR